MKPWRSVASEPFGVHPLAQVAEDLLAGLVAVQRLQLGPLLRLGLADEGEHRLGKDRALAVEALAGDRHVAVLEEVRFDDGLEGGLSVTRDHLPRFLRFPSRVSFAWAFLLSRPT